MITFSVLTLFPESLKSYLTSSMIKRAIEKKKIKINLVAVRDFGTGTHKTVDDRVYGGGAGMLLQFEPFFKALESVVGSTELKKRMQRKKGSKKLFILATHASGKPLTQNNLLRWQRTASHMVVLCGHYEGFDERIFKLVNEKVSLGHYILTGGELPALTILDGITRLIPGVLGNKASLKEESFSKMIAGEYPQYTRPEIITKFGVSLRVPKILLSGNHRNIQEWRKKKSNLNVRNRTYTF